MMMRAHLIMPLWRCCAYARCAVCERGKVPRVLRVPWVLRHGRCMAGWHATGAAAGGQQASLPGRDRLSELDECRS